tara:strand:+ start:549 stop:779 length:231 start_codon:yes stop_codon:yes gene_type:complete
MVEKETVKLDGEKITFKKGALKRQLGVPDSYTFKKSELEKMKKVENGKSFTWKGKQRKMTPLLKRRVVFALTLMKK